MFLTIHSWIRRNASSFIHYMPSDGWWLLNVISTIGALLMVIGFLFLVVSIVYSHIKAPREATGDNWDGLGRTLEWSTASAIPP